MEKDASAQPSRSGLTSPIPLIQASKPAVPISTKSIESTSLPASSLIAPGSLPGPTLLASWHLLSLDAPTVAALWTTFLARANHIVLPWTQPTAMFLAVWVLYAADRLLDGVPTSAKSEQDLAPEQLAPTELLQPCHLFHRRHRSYFIAAIVCTIAALVPLILSMQPSERHLYVILGTLLLAWFLLVHMHPPHNSSRLPKELAVGLFFSAAVFIPTLSRIATSRLPLLTSATLFALLCMLNCLFLHAWQQNPTLTATSVDPSTRLLQALSLLTTAGPLLAAAIHLISPPIALALSLASAALLSLHRVRAHLTPTHLRAAADLVLLTPLLVLPFVR